MKFVWMPEALFLYPATYAPKSYKAGINTMTLDPWNAMQFETKEMCMWWCLDNPFPKFAPVEHGFAEDESRPKFSSSHKIIDGENDANYFVFI